MRLKVVRLFAMALLAAMGTIGLVAISGGWHARSIPMSDLAQLVKRGEITRIEVSGDSALATTREDETLGLRVEPSRLQPAEDRNYQTRSQFDASIAAALAGHAAETLVFGEMSTGAGNDLERATTLARRMVTEYGMSEQLGVVTFGSSSDASGGESRTYSEATAQQVDREVRRLLEKAYARARSVIVEQRAVLDRLAHALLQWETLQGAELERVFAGDAPVSLRGQPRRRSSVTSVARALPAAAIHIRPDEMRLI